jgi:hypothetical protein
MSKAWDKLRVPPEGQAWPISEGSWFTGTSMARVGIRRILQRNGGSGTVILDTHGHEFAGADLRQLAEFLIELADQLEAK